MKKISTLLTAALLTAAIGTSAPTAFAGGNTSIPSTTPNVTEIPTFKGIPSIKDLPDITETEIPNVKIIEDDGGISTFALILSTSATFPLGQGSLPFNYKAPNSGTETVRLYVKNNSAKTINYNLVAPSGTTWLSTSVPAGKSVTTEHVFGASQAGNWVMYFSNSDGSSISVDANVRDGL